MFLKKNQKFEKNANFVAVRYDVVTIRNES